MSKLLTLAGGHKSSEVAICEKRALIIWHELVLLKICSPFVMHFSTGSDVDIKVVVLDRALGATVPTTSGGNSLADRQKSGEGRFVSGAVDARVALGMELLNESGAVLAASRLPILHRGDDGWVGRVEARAQTTVRTTARRSELSVELGDI
jgi:hypothetical protein